MVGQAALFDEIQLLGQTTVEDQVEEAQAEARAAIARAAEAVAAEEAQAERDAESIRAMIGATLPAGAADRWAAGLGLSGAEEPPAPAPAPGTMRVHRVHTVDGIVRVHADGCEDGPKERL